MGEDTIVRRLVEMLSTFFTEGIAVEEDLTFSLTTEFLWNIADVLFSKQIVVFSRWGELFFSNHIDRKLSTPERYTKYLICTCLEADKENFNVFERFLCAFALIIRTSIEVHYRTEKNFCKLVPDIFMEFYEMELKKSFYKCKGFHRLVEYVNNPKYQKSNRLVQNNFGFYDSDTSIPEMGSDLMEKSTTQEGLQKQEIPKNCYLEEEDTDKGTSDLAKSVLENTRPDFLPIPSADFLKEALTDLIEKETAFLNKEETNFETAGKLIKSEETLDQHQRLSYGFVTKADTTGQTADKSRYENIIEAVVKYNHSKNSNHGESRTRYHREVGEVMENLQSKIKFLIEVLDEYDKE